jgi:hypothetical protein
MPDNRENPVHPDSRRVNIHEEHKLNYWTKEFGISEKETKTGRNGSGYIR